MEKAIFITSVRQQREAKKGFSRIYFGQEFCERLIPPCSELISVSSFARKIGMDFTLVTPYVTDWGIKKLIPLLKILSKYPKTEIVFNDWGLLNLLNREFPGLSAVMGRLLTKQKRCPRLIERLKRKPAFCFMRNPVNPEIKILLAQQKLPLELDFYYKGSNAASVPVIHDFLRSLGIKRIEIDNIGQGVSLELPAGLSASLYYPFNYITTTFYCPSAECDGKFSFLKIRPCKRQCRKYIFTLRHRLMPKEIILKGNTKFYSNRRLPLMDLESAGINRTVYAPLIPL